MIGRDKGSFRIDKDHTVNYDRIIGSTIGFRCGFQAAASPVGDFYSKREAPQILLVTRV